MRTNLMNGNFICIITLLTFIFISTSCSNASTVQENTTITFATNSIIRSLYPSLEELVEEFHRQNSSITVQIVNQPDDAWNRDDLNSLASTADVTLLFYSRERLAKNNAFFRDLAPLMGTDMTFKEDDFWPGLLTACQDGEGHILGIPLSVVITGIYYDPSAFDAAGLPYPAPGWTWDDFQRDITAIARANKGQMDYGFIDSTGFFTSILASQVDGYLAGTDGKIESAALAKQVDWYLDLSQAGNLFSYIEPSESRTALFQGKAPAMWIGGLADPSPEKPDQLAVQSYGLAPFPVAADGSFAETTPQFPVCGVISSGSLHVQEAWTWLNFLTRQKMESTLPNHSNVHIPARPSVTEESRYWDAFSASTAAAIRYGLAHGRYGSLYPQTLEQIGIAITKVITEQTDLNYTLSDLTDLLIQETPTPGASALVVVATPQPTESVSEDTVTIKYAGPLMPPFDTTFQKLAEEFHRLHPEIVINVSTDTNCSGGSVNWCVDLNFDCFTANLFGNRIGNYTDDLLILDSFLAADDPSLVNDFYPGLTNAFTADGKLYALPATARMPLLYFNKDILAQKGLTPPTSTWTLDDFLTMAVAVSSGGGPGMWTLDDFRAKSAAGPSGKVEQIFGITAADIYLLDFLAKGWVDYSVDPPVVNLNQPQVVNAFNQVDRLIKDGVLLYSNNLQPLAISDVILSGRVAFWFSTKDLANSFSQFPSRIKIGVAPIPQELEVVDGMGVGTLKAMEGHFISSQTKNPAACWQWITYLSASSNSFLGVPVRRSVAESENWEARVGPETAAVYRAALSQISFVDDPEYTDYRIAYYHNLYLLFHKALGKVVSGTDLRVAITEQQRNIDTYLDCVAPLNISSSSTSQEVSEQIVECVQEADSWSDLQMWP